MPAAVEFAVAEFEYGAGPAPGVDPVFGGTSLRALASRFAARHGWTPGDHAPLISSLALAWFLVPAPDDPCTVLGCVCGDDGCWPLQARIATTDTHVTWSDFANPFRPEWSYDGFGPFVVSRSAYDAAVRDLLERLGTPPA